MPETTDGSNLNNAYDSLNKVNNYLPYIFAGLLIIGIIVGLIYGGYKGALQSNECTNMNSWYSSIDGHIRSAGTDCCGNLYDYYIKTAFNCCCGGANKNDFVNICNLKAIIKQGVRCLDFEVYNIDGEPQVAASTSDSYFVKESYNSVKFSDVMDTIKNYAFSGGACPNPTDPLLIHLRIKSTNQDMYTNLANIFKSYTDIMLGKDYSYENDGKNIGTTPLQDLKGKVILIIDKSNNAFLDNKELLEYVNLTSNSVFMRVLKYNDVKNTPDINELQEFNKRCMTIVLPDNEINPPNPSGIICREAGCQMVAMRYQNKDNFLDEDTKFFDNAGYAFALKPENLRYQEVTIPDPDPQKLSYSYDTRTASTDYYSFDF